MLAGAPRLANLGYRREMTPPDVNLADMSWITFEAGPLGELTIEAFGAEFADAVRSAIASHASGDPHALVRDLLAAHARLTRRSPPVGPEAFGQLGRDEIDAAADSFFLASGAFFRPWDTGAEEAAGGMARPRTNDEPQDLDTAPGDGGAARFQRVLTAWVQDRSVAPIAAGIQPTTLAAQLRRSNPAGFDAVRVAASLRAGGLADQLTNLSRLSAQLRPQLGAADLVRSIGAAGTLRSLALPSPALAHIYSDQAQVRSLLRLAGSARTSGLLEAVAKHPNVLETMLASGAFKTFGTSMMQHAMRDLIQPHRLATSNLTGLLRDQLAFTRLINREYGLRLPAATLAAIGALQAVGDPGVALRSALPVGYQVTAALGVSGAAPQGVVADVLLHYGEQIEEAPSFDATIDLVQVLDAEEEAAFVQKGFFEARFGGLVEMIRAEPDIIKRAGLLMLLTFMLQFASTVFDGIGAYYSFRQVELALEDKAVSASKTETAAVLGEVRSVRAELVAAQQAQVEQDRHVRYVHARSPLRIEANGQAMVLRFVYPDQMLRVVGQSGDWLQVEVFDYHSDKPTQGWVSRRRVFVEPLS